MQRNDQQVETRISFLVPRELKDVFHEIVRRHRTTMTAELVAFIRDYISDEIERQIRLQKIRKRANGGEEPDKSTVEPAERVRGWIKDARSGTWHPTA